MSDLGHSIFAFSLGVLRPCALVLVGTVQMIYAENFDLGKQVAKDLTTAEVVSGYKNSQSFPLKKGQYCCQRLLASNPCTFAGTAVTIAMELY